jgi:hypothetical protein
MVTMIDPGYDISCSELPSWSDMTLFQGYISFCVSYQQGEDFGLGDVL